MSLVLLESGSHTWVAALVGICVLLSALMFVLNIGGNRPHS